MSSDAASVLELGRSMSEALDPSDIVGRWMSHHLADVILRCESSPDDHELIAQTRDLVIKLWTHKAGARFRRRPFEYVDPVFAAFERLEPDPPPWAFYRTFPAGTEPSTEAVRSYPLLMAAISLEREVGQLVRLAVAIAGTEAIALEEPWVVSATALAETEQDRAVQILQRAARRLRARSSDPRQALADAEDETLDVEDLDLDVHGVDTAATASDAPHEMTLPDPDEVLGVALQAALVRCRRALDQLAESMDSEHG